MLIILSTVWLTFFVKMIILREKVFYDVCIEKPVQSFVAFHLLLNL